MILQGQLGQLCKVYAQGGGIRNGLGWGAGATASHPWIFDFVNYALCLFFKNKPSLPPQKGQNYVNEPVSCRKALEGSVLFGITTLRKSSVRSITPSLRNRQLVSPKCSL